VARANPNATVAKNVRALRHKRGISQEQLAELSGLHRTYIGAIEREERNVTLVTLEQVASALGVSCAALLTPVRHKRVK
jgi:transcriptional regulator with XRE-family HTH domain